MKQIPAFTGWLLVTIALALYGYGIFDAIKLSIGHPLGKLAADYPPPLEMMVSGIGAVLLTNLGALLGIAVSVKNSALAALMIPGSNLSETPPVNMREKLQLIALFLYLGGLIACFITWILRDFSSGPSNIVPIVEQQGKTFIGVCSAYIAFILGVKSNN